MFTIATEVAGVGVMQSEPRYNCAEHQHKKWEEKRGPVRETEREQKEEDSFETMVSGKAREKRSSENRVCSSMSRTAEREARVALNQ